MKRERENSSCRQREKEKNNIIKFKHGFLKSVTFFKDSLAQSLQMPFQKERLILIIRRLVLFVLFVSLSLSFFFHLCGGGRISVAGNSFDKPPRLSTQAHVKLSQLWLRSLHTITTRGTKGPPSHTQIKGEKIVCKLVGS